MFRASVSVACGLALLVLPQLCSGEDAAPCQPAEDDAQVRLITLAPGHFHAALVQKTMYAQIAPLVHVYAPPGPDVADHLRRIEGFNNRAENPTAWEERVYTGADFLERLLAERRGNVVVIAGNNRHKTAYIKAGIDAGLHVLADKPMCIDAAGCRLLADAFETARQKDVLLYDIMTERSEITTVLQRELASRSAVFGELTRGSREHPAVIKESVHHFFKYVAGNPIRRPAWYFDTTQQGEGIVDVTAHLVDLVMWTCFPEQAIDFDRDVQMLRARHWPTAITRAQFEQVTGLEAFPEFLQEKLNAGGALPCYCNGELAYRLRGVFVRIAVRWDFAAPAGGRDTHFSVMRGSRATLIVRQGKEQAYQPELFVEPAAGHEAAELATALKQAMADLQETHPGLALAPQDAGWHVLIPDKYRVGHEAHFRQVMERYLRFLAEGKLPPWEVPNMLTKYRTTTAALELAQH